MLMNKTLSDVCMYILNKSLVKPGIKYKNMHRGSIHVPISLTFTVNPISMLSIV